MAEPEDETWEDVVERPMPRYVMEEPVVGRTWLLEAETPWDSNRPDTDLQALMEAAPNEPLRESREAQSRRAESLDWIIREVLTEDERAVIEVTVFAGHSIRKASEILGWPRSTVHRLKKSALQIIERELNAGKD